MLHSRGPGRKSQQELEREQNLSQYTNNNDFMNLDENMFELDSESRDLIFGNSPCRLARANTGIGRNGMNENGNQQRDRQNDPSAMQTDSTTDMNTILSQMPTPVSNDIRAQRDTSTFMSPLQVDRRGYEQFENVNFQPHGNEEVPIRPYNVG